MSEPLGNRLGPTPSRAAQPYGQGSSANLADILERVLDKGIVIAGDIQINLLDIELLTIKLRLLVASVDKAKEMGIDWWEHDPSLSSRARGDEHSLAEENRRLRAELAALRESEELVEAEPELLDEGEEDEEEAEPRGGGGRGRVGGRGARGRRGRGTGARAGARSAPRPPPEAEPR
ncbi:gas vesicle protein [Streptomyces bauhiniae]|uniref:gas vesicle protein n=1 Tax=Streptomyces bauhiniae TaxID=2340725 RepID=UPI00362F1695